MIKFISPEKLARALKRVGQVITNKVAAEANARALAISAERTTSDSRYLAKTGGTMTGSITSSKGLVASRADDTGYLYFTGGSTYTKGATAYLYGQDQASHPGCFLIQAKTSAATKELLGKPDGTLTWNGKNVSLEDHTHSAATTAAAGFMSAADKQKLDRAAPVTVSETDLTPGESALTTGEIYLVYE